VTKSTLLNSPPSNPALMSSIVALMRLGNAAAATSDERGTERDWMPVAIQIHDLRIPEGKTMAAGAAANG
jgi:hypothetical protein